MRRQLTKQLTTGLAVAAAAASLAQSPPAPNFELILPGLNRTIPGGANVVADIPVKQVDQLTIQIMGSAETNLTYGDVRVRINGKGTRNVFDSGSNARGKFFAMNPQTLKMRHDQIFDRAENTIEVYGKDKRGREYYQNWILRSGGDLNPYFTYISQMSPGDEAGVPPDLSLETPNAPLVFPAGKDPSVKMHLRGAASAAGGIASVTVNGKPVDSPKKAAVALEADTTVARGTRAVVVEVADAKGNRRSVSIPVIYPGTGGPPPKLAGQPWALVIGVSRFAAKTGAPPNLPLAAFDARELAESLKARGFRESNMRVLLEERATVEQIRTALGDFTTQAKPDDFLLVYWATQGLHDPASPDKVYLAAADTQVLHMSDTAIEISELQLLIERAVRSRHTLFFFDADHPLGPDWAFQGKPIVNTHLLNLFDDQLGRSIVVAGPSSGGGSGRSVFANAVIEGLEGKADIDENRVVTGREICDYVVEQVRSSTSGSQIPRALVSKRDEAPVMTLK